MKQASHFGKAQSLEIKRAVYASVPKEYRAGLDSLFASLNYDNYSPVRRMEEALGISGIYHQYDFPGGMPPLEFEALMKPMRVYEILEKGLCNKEEQIAGEYMKAAKSKSLFAIRRMYDELTTLNPELKAAHIEPTQIRSYVAVISGACSGFPPEDIIEFSRATKGSANDRINDEKRRFSKFLEEKTGKRRSDGGPLVENWCPSLKTRNRILNILGLKNEREVPAPRGSLRRAVPDEELAMVYGNEFYNFMNQRGMFD